jgi:aconitate decarboxylase
MSHGPGGGNPQGLTSAQMNLPFCVTTLLAEGDVFVDQFSGAVVTGPRRMALAAKVDVVHDPAVIARGAKFRHMVRVDVQFVDGAVESETVEAPRGSEQKFASEADMVEKFRKLARRDVPDAQAKRIVELTLGCGKLDEVGKLASALAIRRWNVGRARAAGVSQCGKGLFHLCRPYDDIRIKRWCCRIVQSSRQ